MLDEYPAWKWGGWLQERYRAPPSYLGPITDSGVSTTSLMSRYHTHMRWPGALKSDHILFGVGLHFDMTTNLMNPLW